MSTESHDAEWAWNLVRDKEWKGVSVTVGGDADLRRLRRQVTLLQWTALVQGVAIALVGIAALFR